MLRFYRNRVPGGTFFFTAVTHERRGILTTALGRRCLREAIASVRAARPFEVVALCLLPDHVHTVWILPDRDDDYSTRWQLLKRAFTRAFITGGGGEGRLSDARRRQRDRGVWQRRFWEHTCRNEPDLKRCVDYLHWNPVKHGLTERVPDWAWSSFHRFVRLGEYPRDWGGENPCPGFTLPE